MVNPALGIRRSALLAARDLAARSPGQRRADHRVRPEPPHRGAAGHLSEARRTGQDGCRHPRLSRRLSAARAARDRARAPGWRGARRGRYQRPRAGHRHRQPRRLRASSATRARSPAPGSKRVAPVAATSCRSTVMVATSSPLDQFLAAHPEYLFDRSVEAALVNPNNLHILTSHLKCAAFELHFEDGEPFGLRRSARRTGLSRRERSAASQPATAGTGWPMPSRRRT